MAKLGYTWYPKDWGNSESVFELNLSERGLYRELIDLAMLNDNKTEVKLEVWSRKFAVDIESLKSILGKLSILNLIKIDGEKLFIPSCESRLNLARGGSNGGKKSKPIAKAIVKPSAKPTGSLEEKNDKPMSNQIEKKENIKEIESKNKSEIPFKNLNQDFYDDLLISETWVETVCMQNTPRFNKTQVLNKLLEFKIDLEMRFDKKANKGEFASHFIRWLNLQKNNSVKPFFDSPA
jgi:hypothetical protein